MKILIMHQTIVDSDAIGHDIKGMYDVLERHGYEVYIYCQFYNMGKDKQTISYDQVMALIKSKSNIIIYHHSFYWEQGEEILNQAVCQVIMRYHNITPPVFFSGYNEDYFNGALKGRQQTDRLLRKYPHFYWLCPSYFNSFELLKKGLKQSKIAVLPPFHEVERISEIKENTSLSKKLKEEGFINVLMIGRVSPHKGHQKICQVAKAYKQNLGTNIRFWVVGKLDSHFKAYYDEMELWLRENGVEELVHFTDGQSMSDLKSFLVQSDVYLCLSDHEGFGVPLIEAQYFQLPVISLDSSAIKETLGGNQLVFDQFDENLIASAIHAVGMNKEFSQALAKQGWKNYQSRFSPQLLEDKLIKLLTDPPIRRRR